MMMRLLFKNDRNTINVITSLDEDTEKQQIYFWPRRNFNIPSLFGDYFFHAPNN